MTDNTAPHRLLRPLFLATAAGCAAFLALPALLRADALAAPGGLGLVGVFTSLGCAPVLLAPRPASEPHRLRTYRMPFGASLFVTCGALFLR